MQMEYRVSTKSYAKFKNTNSFGAVDREYTIKCNNMAEAFQDAVSNEGIVELKITRME